jgi:glycosyltransferase involved in cell wall biosynthesis
MIVAGIPAYNEEKFIGRTILLALKYADRVIVVDDSSVDLTYEIARRVGAITIRHKQNMGYGETVHTLLKEAKKHKADILVILDPWSDPSEIPFLVGPILKGEAGMVFQKPTDTSIHKKIKRKLLTQFLIHASNLFALSSDLIQILISKIDSDQLNLEHLPLSYVRNLGTNVLEIETSYLREYFEKYLDYLAKFYPIYFDQKELNIVDQKVVSIEERSRLPFMNLLSQYPAGLKNWKNYENICKKVLTYLFVPPLSPPIEQSYTENGLHRRDLIFHVPYDVTGFWKHIQNRYFSEALIVECKNYSYPLNGNEIIIFSKYLGKYRLGTFGIVLSRYGLSDSAKKEMKRLCRDEQKLILCLNDTDLEKMISLKESSQEPELIIDNIRRTFLVSL